MAKKIATKFDCATEFTLDVLGGKWKTVILCYLRQRPLRYSELRKLVPRLSDKVLTDRLKELTAKGLVQRDRSSGNRTGAVYSLTERSHSLKELLKDLYSWGLDHADEFGVTLRKPSRLSRI
jgi:DNA-binding HxlR family transcriptional regulator